MLARRASGVQAATVNLALETLDADDSYVDLGSNGFATGSTNRTFTAWVYPTVDQSSTKPIFSLGDFNPGEAWRVLSSSGNLRIALQGDGYTTSLSMSLNTWQFIAVVLDGTNLQDHTFYLDGSSETSASAGSLTVSTSSYSAYISNYEHGTLFNQDHFDGKLDDVRIYNVALSSGDISTLYNNRGAAVVQTNLVGWWKFDEGTAGAAATGTDSIIDSSSSGKHGTPVNSPYYRAV